VKVKKNFREKFKVVVRESENVDEEVREPEKVGNRCSTQPTIWHWLVYISAFVYLSARVPRLSVWLLAMFSRAMFECLTSCCNVM